MSHTYVGDIDLNPPYDKELYNINPNDYSGI